MFQYAALYATAAKVGTDFCIPYSNAANPRADYQLLQVFELPSLKVAGWQRRVPIVRERSFTYDAKLQSECPKEADLRGYFQTEKYFHDVASEIRKEFRFKPEIERHCQETVSRLGQSIISLHVRRGDYVQKSEEFPLCSLDYYAEALSMMPEKLPVLVFSDDIEWCRAQSLFRERRFRFVHGYPNYYDMCLMSNCDHHIIANSSFSWWGAWLGKNDNKKIVAPKRWFGTAAKLDARDLVPDNWSRI